MHGFSLVRANGWRLKWLTVGGPEDIGDSRYSEFWEICAERAGSLRAYGAAKIMEADLVACEDPKRLRRQRRHEMFRKLRQAMDIAGDWAGLRSDAESAGLWR